MRRFAVGGLSGSGGCHGVVTSGAKTWWDGSRYVETISADQREGRDGQARQVLAALQDRMAEVGLQLHPDRTRICVHRRTRGATPRFRAHVVYVPGLHVSGRAVRGPRTGSMFVSFAPAISKDALKKIGQEVRSWRLHRRTPQSFSELARWVNPIVRGWMQYYGAFYRSALYPLLTRINAYLMRWVRKKYRRFQGRREFQQAWQRVTTQYPRFFAHWVWTTAVPAVW